MLWWFNLGVVDLMSFSWCVRWLLIDNMLYIIIITRSVCIISLFLMIIFFIVSMLFTSMATMRTVTYSRNMGFRIFFAVMVRSIINCIGCVDWARAYLVWSFRKFWFSFFFKEKTLKWFLPGSFVSILALNPPLSAT